MLISSPRQTQADLDIWASLEQADQIYYGTHKMLNWEIRALDDIAAFWSHTNQRGYCGVSWGKDSTVLAHLVARTESPVPLVWVRVSPIFSPECEQVEKVFLERFPDISYRRIETTCWTDKNGNLRATGTLEAGFKRAVELYGDYHISGVRGAEAGNRALRMKRWGVSTDRTCCPIGNWSTEQVYAYLTHYALPVHPAYAMTGGGRYDRNYIRVSSLGCSRGRGMGRLEWEQEYYPDIIRRRNRDSYR